MKRFNYKVVINEIGTKPGFQPLTPKVTTVHHTAVKTDKNYDVIARLKGYVNRHNGVMPYHFYIPYNDSEDIYCTQYVDKATVHCSNWDGNRNSLAICLEGNFQEQVVLEKQLEKLAQLLDDFSNKWFSKNGWTNFDQFLNPRDNVSQFTYSGIKVFGLNYHNEIAQKGFSTACCGKNLIGFVLDYRAKKGEVDWKYKDESVAWLKIEKGVADMLQNQLAKVNRDYLGSLTGELALDFPEFFKIIEGNKVLVFPEMQKKFNKFNESYLDMITFLKLGKP